MAPTLRLAALAAAALLTACGSDRAEPASAPAPTASPTFLATIPDVPDLGDAVIDCDAVDGPCEPGDDETLDLLWGACADGDPGACDRLYYDAPFDSRYEQFGNTCGDRDVLVPCEDHAPLQPTRSSE